MFHGECWKHIYFGVRRSKMKVTSHKNIAGVSLCTLVSAGFFWLFSVIINNCIRVVYRLATNWIIGHIQGTTYYMGVEIPTGRDNFGGCSAH